MTQFRASAAALSLTALLAGCGGQDPQAAQDQTIDVAPLVVAPRSQAILADLPGRISPVRVAEVRARVAGIVQKRHFEEGATVKEGDLLFTIEPAPFEAALARAQGALARAQAQVRQAQALADRYQPLVKIAAVSRQEYDDAVAALQTAKANQVSAQADVKTAQLDLGYASVRAPISGRIGRGLVTEGSLVGQGESTPMALIQQLDPVYADFRQPVNALLAARGGGRGAGRAGGQRARRRHRLHGQGQAAVLRRFGGSGHGPGDAARPVQQSRRTAAAGHVRARQRRAGRAEQRHLRAAARRHARRRRTGQGAGRGRRQGAGASGADRRHAGSEWQITQDWPRATRSSSTAPPRSRPARRCACKRPAPRRPPSKPRNERDRPARRPASAPRQP